MTRPAILDEADIQARLAKLDGWTVEGDKLHRTFRFADFSEAFGFMSRAALVAEKLDHHPEWSNVWNRVEVDLVTHDARAADGSKAPGLTDLDFALAEAMDRIAAPSR